jgi:hypothetical protein
MDLNGFYHLQMWMAVVAQVVWDVVVSEALEWGATALAAMVLAEETAATALAAMALAATALAATALAEETAATALAATALAALAPAEETAATPETAMVAWPDCRPWQRCKGCLHRSRLPGP